MSPTLHEFLESRFLEGPVAVVVASLLCGHVVFLPGYLTCLIGVGQRIMGRKTKDQPSSNEHA